MPSKFQSTVEQRDRLTFVKLAGVIDEDNDLVGLSDQVAGGTLVINVSDIERINSCGVRDWVNWLGRIECGGSKVVLVECSPSIVAQVNLVSNFTGGGVVKSFYAPYFCAKCDREKALLIETREAAGKHPFKAPTCRCDECDGAMDFDDMEDSYFAFLENSAKVSDAKLDAAMSALGPSDSGSRLRTRTGSTPPSGPSASAATGTPPVNGVPTSASVTQGSLPSIKRATEKLPSGNTGRVPLAPNTGRVPLAPNTGRVPLAPNTGRVPLAGNTGRVPLAANTGRVPLAANTGRVPLATPSSLTPAAIPAVGAAATTMLSASVGGDLTVATPSPPAHPLRTIALVGVLVAMALGLVAFLLLGG